MKRTTKVLSSLLAWMLLFNSMVFSAVSEEALPVETETASDMSAVITGKYEAGDEIVEWSGEGVKHYYLGDGQYQAVVKADEEMLQTKSQQVATRSSTTVTSRRIPLDTHISSSAQSTNYGDVDGVRVGIGVIGLFYESKISLPTNANIQSSSFCFAYYYNVSDGYLTVGAYAVEEYWDEYEVTWDDMEVYPNMGISTELCGSATLTASSTCNATNPTWASVDITDIVRSWYSGERHNEGIALKRTGGTNNSVIIKSYESEQEAYYSYYTINYTLMSEDRVSNGEYYFKNQEFGKYVQPDNNVSSTTEGAITEIWDFNRSFNQRWNITYLYNGYYRIISTVSSKALTAPTNKDSSITQTVYTGSNKQQWSITLNADGTYKFSPRSNESYCMSAGEGLLTSRGRNVEMRSSQSDDRDAWVLEPLDDYQNHSFKVRIYYDDSLPYTEDEILEMYREAVAGFVSEFGIVFEMPIIEYMPNLNVSTNCPYKSNIGTICNSTCGALANCGTEHHKSSERLINLNTSTTYYTIRLVGYAICYNDNGDHDEVWGLGNVNGKNSVITAQSMHFIETIQHELTHNLGQGHDNCTAFDKCVLKGGINYWCDACKQAINNNIN